MAFFQAQGAGIPSSLKTGMNQVLNKKFWTSTTYPPTTWPDNVNLLGPLPEKTVSGAIASFSDGADDVPIKSASFGIVASGGNGTPSAPVPIVGKSSVTVYQTGKNLVDNSASAWENGTINSSGNNVSGSGTRTIGYFEIKGGETYKISGIQAPETASDFRIFFYDKNKDFITYRNYNSTPTIPSNACYFRVRNISIADISALQIEYGDTTTTYEAYKSKTPITVSLGRTIYGGYVTNDKVVKTWSEPIVFTGAESENWIWGQNGGFYRANITVYGFAYTVGARSECLCNMGTYKASGNDYNACFIYGNPTSAQFFFYPPQGVESLADFKTWLSSNNLQMVAELATPIVITGLDEISINTYLGDNNIWCDTGDSEIVYRADISLLLQALQNNRGVSLMMARHEPENEEPEQEETDETR